MSVQYSCAHLDDPHAPLPPSAPSSSTSYQPLPQLYFCEECDAVRCNLCAAVEVASYFCPNCLFDVPSANVRADRNRCARNCFSCPSCESSLAVQATERVTESGPVEAGAPYVLGCPGCKWTSREVGWKFDKPTSLAAQVQRLLAETETVQSEFEAIKDHLESYMTATAPAPAPKPGKSKQPSRHIQQLTAKAAKALNRDVPGLGMMGARPKRRDEGTGEGKGKGRTAWDELADFNSKHSWKTDPLDLNAQDQDQDERPALDKLWTKSSATHTQKVLPERIRLQAKLTKRCPHPNCRHLLIQPDTKSTRFKIKMVAMSYLPGIEIGRRRRRTVPGHEVGPATSVEDLENKRRERRKTRLPAAEEDEPMGSPLRPGSVYTYQLAFVNPLYDPIQIRLVPSTRRDAHATTSIYVPVPHFTVNALKDAWAYDDDEEEEGHGGSEEASEEGSSTVSGTTRSGTLGKKSRSSVLGALGGAGTDRRKRDHGVEKRGNMSNVGIEIEILPDAPATSQVAFDMEVRYTYRADETEGEDATNKGKEAYKMFTFWVRLDIGRVAG